MIPAHLYRDDAPPGLLARALRKFLASTGRAFLQLRSMASRSQLIDPTASNLAVSLTSYGHRVTTVHLAVESIGFGKLKPSRIILWLDEFERESDLPAALVRAKKRGLEIRKCDDLGPHKKYYPFVQDESYDREVLVTADDDVLYPRRWLRSFAEAHARWPNDILCFRAHRMASDGYEISPYTTWLRETSTSAGYDVFATGVSGVLYPTGMVRQLRIAGTGFNPVALTADDIWLHRVALRSEVKVRQLFDCALLFLSLPGTSEIQLAHGNVAGGKNDAVIAQLYDASDIARIADGHRE